MPAPNNVGILGSCLLPRVCGRYSIICKIIIILFFALYNFEHGYTHNIVDCHTRVLGNSQLQHVYSYSWVLEGQKVEFPNVTNHVG